jgi:hypothetical protein
MEYYYYLIIFLLIYIIFRFYIIKTYKFWAYQPVFHYYNLLYWIYKTGVINTELPESNKFCNFINITNKDFFDYSDNEIKEIVKLLRNHYNRNEEANYLPTINYFKTFFTGHTLKCFISVYNNNNYILDGNNAIINNNKIIGVITGKPINISIKNIPKFKAYYVDFLCVHQEHRSKNIAPQLIQTYEYTQRHSIIESQVSLFKREGKLTGIVPLTIYKTYMFETKHILSEPIIADNRMNQPIIIIINDNNYNTFIDYVNNNQTIFDCIIAVDKTNLLALIKSNIYIIYGLLQDNKLVACYFYKTNCITYTIDNPSVCKSIDLIASISNCSEQTFIVGFILSLNKYMKDSTKISKDSINFINIENISNNNRITHYLLNKSVKAKIITPMAYFFYNFVKKPLISDKILIII